VNQSRSPHLKLLRKRLRRGKHNLDRAKRLKLAEPVEEKAAGVSHLLLPLIVLLVFLLHHAVDLPETPPRHSQLH
jgi:hypothetical protein